MTEGGESGLDVGAERWIGDLAAAAVVKAADARRNHLVDILAGNLACVTAHDKAAVQELLCGYLEQTGAGGPEFDPWGLLRNDAEFWATCATPQELEVYTFAGLRAIERRNFAVAARKRILVAMWESLPVADRATFLARVDPQGKFRAGA